MALGFLVIGLILIITAFKNTYRTLGSLIVEDMTTGVSGSGISGGFLIWVGVLFAIGLLGYVPQLRSISRAFIGLMLVVLFITQGGFFDKFKQALSGATTSQAGQQAVSQEPQFQSGFPVKVSQAGGGGGPGVGDVAKAATSIAGFL